MKILQELKENNQDFEFYPTTQEIIDAIHNDLNKLSNDLGNLRFNERKDNGINNLRLKIDYSFKENTKIFYPKIESVIDVGAGDGRVLKSFKSSTKYAIEKSYIHIKNLLNENIKVIGNDFYETYLYDKNFDILFSNPPYSIFEDWCTKILDESNSKLYYLVIPERFENNITLVNKMKDKGSYKIIGQYDFLEADRKARANVSLVRIISNNDDSFNSFINKNIGNFKSDEIIELEEEEEETNKKVINKKEAIENLVDSYNYDLNKLINTFKKLGEIDFSIIEALGIKKNDIQDKIKSDISNLKSKYWDKCFNTLDSITDKLTYNKREKMLNEIKWFNSMDFNISNIRTIIIWVLENYSKLSIEQMVDVYDKLTDYEQVKPYKSNKNWVTDNWRYNKDSMGAYKLDYRIVVYFRISEYGWERFKNNTIHDLCVVASSLGFKVNEFPNEEKYYIKKEKHFIKSDDDILFEYTLHYNGNVHIKPSKDLLKLINIEVGKTKGWIKAPKDISDEFNIDLEEALNMFKKNMFLTSDVKLLK